MDLSKVCYNHPDPAICDSAWEVCWNGVVKWYDGESGKGGRNRFDITAPCEMDGFCYKNIEMIQKYLNKRWVFEALGVPKAVSKYEVASDAVAIAFSLTNDPGISTEPQVLYLLESGIDVLFYQGNLDLACNTAGNLKWASEMPWKGQPEFVSKSLTPWFSEGKAAGTFKDVKIQMVPDKKTRFGLLTVSGAGHMVRLFDSCDLTNIAGSHGQTRDCIGHDA
jgi:cathepsin A (carboxypeptidase C)